MKLIDIGLFTDSSKTMSFVALVCIFVAVIVCLVLVIISKKDGESEIGKPKDIKVKNTPAIHKKPTMALKSVGEILEQTKPQTGTTIKISPRLTLMEAYALLDWEQKSFFTRLRNYALSKPTAKENRTMFYIQINGLNKPLIKLSVKGGKVQAKFKIENEFYRSFKKENAKENGIKLDVKETPVLLTNTETYSVARGLIDITFNSAKQDAEVLHGEAYVKRLLNGGNEQNIQINADENSFLSLAKEWEILPNDERQQNKFN